MKNYLLLLLLLAITWPSMAQWNPMFEKKMGEDQDEKFVRGIEAKNGMYYLLGNRYDAWTEKDESVVYRMNKYGEMSSVVIKKTAGIALSSIIEREEGILVLGGYSENNKDSLILQMLSWDLAPQWQKAYAFQEGFDDLLDVNVLNYMNGKLLAFAVVYNGSYSYSSTIYAFNNDYSLAKNKLYSNDEGSVMIKGLCLNDDATKLFAFGEWGHNMIEAVEIHKQSLEPVNTSVLSSGSFDVLLPDLYVKSLPNNKWLYNGSLVSFGPNGSEDRVILSVFNSAFDVQTWEMLFQEEDNLRTIAMINGLDYVDSDKLYFVLNHGPEKSGGEHKNSWAMVGLTDSELAMDKIFYYGGDADYSVNSILATTDGGCIVMGSYFDFENNPGNGEDFFAVKLHYNFVGMDESGMDEANGVKIYPNPGDDVLQINTTLKNPRLIMIDALGREVFNQNLISSQSVIYTRGFASGRYTYQLISGEQHVSGIWIKQ